MQSALFTLLLCLGIRGAAEAQLLAARENPIAYGHHHIDASDVEAHKRFWIDALGGSALRIGTSPGVNLTFAPSADPVVPTRGRSLDHIGFEIRGLEDFVRRLEASGVTMDRGYTPVPALGIAVAFFMDPWGTYVELTEGLAAVQ